MPAFKNTMLISSIQCDFQIPCFCPLGEKSYTNQLSIIFTPDELIPDYLDIERDTKALRDTVLTIEDAVNLIFQYMLETYKPKTLKVISVVTDAKHFPVTVIKEI